MLRRVESALLIRVITISTGIALLLNTPRSYSLIASNLFENAKIPKIDSARDLLHATNVLSREVRLVTLPRLPLIALDVFSGSFRRLAQETYNLIKSEAKFV